MSSSQQRFRDRLPRFKRNKNKAQDGVSHESTEKSKLASHKGCESRLVAEEQQTFEEVNAGAETDQNIASKNPTTFKPLSDSSLHSIPVSNPLLVPVHENRT